VEKQKLESAFLNDKVGVDVSGCAVLDLDEITMVGAKAEVNLSIGSPGGLKMKAGLRLGIEVRPMKYSPIIVD